MSNLSKMTVNISELRKSYLQVKDSLDQIAIQVEGNLYEVFEGVAHIDRITSRVKTLDSFLNKALKSLTDGSLKYTVPFKEIQDFIGARIVVYFKSDVPVVSEKVKEYFKTIEKQHLIPDDVRKFGYEGTHLVCSIPSFMYPETEQRMLLPDFFEVQIKTLYQHAWSQANHGLGYKPGTPLSFDDERRLAFLSAQSWGADTMLMDLLKGN